MSAGVNAVGGGGGGGAMGGDDRATTSATPGAHPSVAGQYTTRWAWSATARGAARGVATAAPRPRATYDLALQI